MERQQADTGSVVNSDEADATRQEQNFEIPTHNHGGPRNNKTFGDKLTCCELHNIKKFLQEKRCYCKNECMEKVFNKGELGVQIVYDLRKARFESKYREHSTARQLRSLPCSHGGFFSHPGGETWLSGYPGGVRVLVLKMADLDDEVARLVLRCF